MQPAAEPESVDANEHAFVSAGFARLGPQASACDEAAQPPAALTLLRTAAREASDPFGGLYVGSTGMTNPPKSSCNGLKVSGARPERQVVVVVVQTEISTLSVEECRASLERLLGSAELTAPKVAALLSNMLLVDVPDGADSLPWNPSTFYLTIEQMVSPPVRVSSAQAPELNWEEVFDGLDNPRFLVKSLGAFAFLTTVLAFAFSEKEFPVHKLYTPWKINKVGHVRVFFFCLCFVAVQVVVRPPDPP